MAAPNRPGNVPPDARWNGEYWVLVGTNGTSIVAAWADNGESVDPKEVPAANRVGASAPQAGPAPGGNRPEEGSRASVAPQPTVTANQREDRGSTAQPHPNSREDRGVSPAANDEGGGAPPVPAAPPPVAARPADPAAIAAAGQNSGGAPAPRPAPFDPAATAAMAQNRPVPAASAAPASAAAAGVPTAQPVGGPVLSGGGGGGAPEVPAAPPAVDARQSVRWNGSTYEVEVNPGNWVPTPVEMVQQGYRDGTLRFTDQRGNESGRIFNVRQNEDTGRWEMLEIGADGQPVGGPTNWKPVYDESAVQGILASGQGLLVPHYQGEQARVPGQQGAPAAQGGTADAKQESGGPQASYRLNPETNTWEVYAGDERGWVSAGGQNVGAVVQQGRGVVVPYFEGGQPAAVPSGVLPTSGQVGTVATAQNGQTGQTGQQGKNGFTPVKQGFDFRPGADPNKYDANDVQEYEGNPGGRMYFIKNKETGRYDNFDYNDERGPLQKSQKAETAGGGAGAGTPPVAAGGPAVPTAPPPVGGMGVAPQAATPSPADQQKEREAQRERDLAMLGQNFERPSGIPQRFAAGGQMPPMPDDGATPAVPDAPPSLNAIVGEGRGKTPEAGAHTAELVLVPDGQGGYDEYVADGPVGGNLPEGTIITPLPPHLERVFKQALPPLPGRPLTQNGSEFSDAASGAPIPSAPAGPQAYEFGGTVMGQNPYSGTGYNPYLGLTPPQTGNARQFNQMTQAQMDRYNQSLIAAGDLEGAQGMAARLNRTAPPKPDGLTYYN